MKKTRKESKKKTSAAFQDSEAVSETGDDINVNTISTRAAQFLSWGIEISRYTEIWKTEDD